MVGCTAGITSRDRVADELPVALVAVTVKVSRAEFALGVPLTTPVLVSSETPVGKVPLTE